MSDASESTTAPGGARRVSGPSRGGFAPPWGVVLVAGLAAFLLGVVLAAWPGETVTVLAFLLAIQLIILGAAQVVLAFSGAEGAQRWASVLSGLISFGVGVLFLFDPLQTLTFIGWIIGICVIAVGAADLFGALVTRGARHRAWQAVRGLLGVVVGVLLVANPKWSLGAVVVIAVVWLVGYGFLTIFAAFALRAEEKRSHA